MFQLLQIGPILYFNLNSCRKISSGNSRELWCHIHRQIKLLDIDMISSYIYNNFIPLSMITSKWWCWKMYLNKTSQVNHFVSSPSYELSTTQYRKCYCLDRTGWTASSISLSVSYELQLRLQWACCHGQPTSTRNGPLLWTLGCQHFTLK
jgi:hypothetical protein